MKNNIHWALATMKNYVAVIIGFKALLHISYHTWALSRENMTLLHVNNKDADHPEHSDSLISTFVVCCLQSMITKLNLSHSKLQASI